MAQNLLQTPSLWPTLQPDWNGTAYVVFGSATTNLFALSGYTTVTGDTMSANFGYAGTGFLVISVLVNGTAIMDSNGNTSETISNGNTFTLTWSLPAGHTNVQLSLHYSATGTSTATPPPVAPVAANGSLIIAANSGPHVTPTSFTKSGSPITPTSVAIVSGPSHGTAIVSGISIDYTPDVDFNGADSFTYNGVYGGLTSNTATINIFVDPVPTPPSVLLRWSDDGGHNWSNEIIASAGETGETSQRVIFRRLGSTRRNTGLDRIFEISGDDYNQVALVGASINDG